MTDFPSSALFFSGIHMDMLGSLEASALLGSSNPGHFTSMPGGASLNSASVASLLGLDCAVIGIVGDDAGGKTLIQTLNRRNIKNLLTVRVGATTGSYTSIIEPDGNLLIALADLGLNEEMDADQLLADHTKPMAAADIWFLNSNLSEQILLKLTDRNLKIRPKLLTAASISPSKAQKLAPSLANLDVLFTNIAEASAMLNVIDGKPYNSDKLPGLECIERIQALGVIKGSLSQGAEILWVWEGGELHKFQPTQMNNMADVTGAGDALAGAFLAGLAEGNSLAKTAPIAIAAAQMTITLKGPYNDKINWQELKSRAVKVKQLA